MSFLMQVAGSWH